MPTEALIVVAFVCTAIGLLILGLPSLSYGHRTLIAVGYEILVIAGTYLGMSPLEGRQIPALGISALAVIVIAVRGFRLAVLSVRHESGWAIGLFGLLGNLAAMGWGAFVVLFLVALSQMH
ncbi:MAG TPA: hypothetical protein VKR38_03090 [Usitatibacter sp.]|nr:hypothetical protein [Usitatibacter sp.]